MEQGTCRLCQKEADLHESHILPAFIFRWLKKSSGNGYLRSGLNPNKRVQDGEKPYWLCTTCEELFSGLETSFTNSLFYPYLEDSGKQFHYSRWLLHFCTSLSWRVLLFHLDSDNSKDWAEEDLVHIDKAEQTWREFLLGEREHPGPFRQHLLPLDQIQSTTGEFAPNINRYLMRAIALDVCYGDKNIFTYTKLGRFIVLGFVREPNPNHWKGSKVNANKGIVEPKEYILPEYFMEYLNESAKHMAERLNSVSDKQQTKIDSAFRKNKDHYIGSDEFQAMSADVNMFGDEAFSERKKPKKPNPKT